MNTLKTTLLVCLIQLSLFVTLHAQSGRRPIREAAEPIRIITTEVKFNVTVRDSLGQPVAGLQAEDFSIYDNGKRYEPLRCETQRAPLQVLLLLDETSGLSEGAAQFNSLLQNFCRALSPADRFAVMQFSAAVALTRDWAVPTDAPAHLFQRERRTLSHAAIYDALLFAATKMQETVTEAEPRRVILLFTSGLNTAGLGAAENALFALQATDITLYTFSETEALAAAWQRKQKRKSHHATEANALPTLLAEAELALTRLTEKTDGKLFFPLQTNSLRWMLDDVRLELQSRYTLTYAPALEAIDFAALPAFHRIRVLVRGNHQAVTSAGYETAETAARHFDRNFRFLPTRLH